MMIGRKWDVKKIFIYVFTSFIIFGIIFISSKKRIYNESNLNTKLFNKKNNSPEYYLSAEWVYDHKGNYTEEKTYNEKTIISFSACCLRKRL